MGEDFCSWTSPGTWKYFIISLSQLACCDWSILRDVLYCTTRCPSFLSPLVRLINLIDTINILLTSFSRSELQTTDPRFFPLIYSQRALRLGHKSTRKNSVRNLQYRPRSRVVRGVKCLPITYQFHLVSHCLRLKETNKQIQRTTNEYNQRKESEEHVFTYVAKNTNRLDAMWPSACRSLGMKNVPPSDTALAGVVFVQHLTPPRFISNKMVACCWVS